MINDKPTKQEVESVAIVCRRIGFAGVLKALIKHAENTQNNQTWSNEFCEEAFKSHIKDMKFARKCIRKTSKAVEKLLSS